MNELLVAAVTALWLGILTSISPCPLAANIAAVSFVGRRVEHPRWILLTGLLYTLGRALVYTAMGALLVTSVLSVPSVADFVQVYMNRIMGPLLILVGMVLLDLIGFGFGASCLGSRAQGHAERFGIWGALPLGMILALSFCPISAALFFGSLVPLAAKSGSPIVLPLLFGIGTALPVIVFALLLAFGAHAVARAFHRVTRIERWARFATGTIFILVGIYFSLVYIYGLKL